MRSVRNVIASTCKGIRGYADPVEGGFVPSVGAVLDVLCGPMSEWIDAAALAEGEACHEAMKTALTDYDPNCPPVSTNVRAHALLEWLRKEGLVPIEHEQSRSSVLGFAGKPDAFLTTLRSGLGKRIVADWKFAESLTVRYDVQVNAYGKLFPHVDKLLLVQVTRAGVVKPKWLTPNPAHYAAFVGALSVLRWRLAH